jgi:hypothetical protein
MTTCAVCQLSDGLVINIIVADPTDPCADGCQLIVTPTETGSYANIGFTWNGTEFINPNPTIEVENAD